MAFALVQQASNEGATASLVVGSGQGWATPTAGNLLVAHANSDGTCTVPSGWTAGPSVVDGNGAYAYYKISAGNESTVTFGNSAVKSVVGCLEYSGNSPSPFDAQSSSTIAGVLGTVTTAVSTASSAPGLVVAMALIHGNNQIASGPSWTNSFVNRQSKQNTGGGITCTSYVGDLYPASSGSYSTNASWTTSVDDRQQLQMAFKEPTIQPEGTKNQIARSMIDMARGR